MSIFYLHVALFALLVCHQNSLCIISIKTIITLVTKRNTTGEIKQTHTRTYVHIPHPFLCNFYTHGRPRFIREREAEYMVRQSPVWYYFIKLSIFTEEKFNSGYVCVCVCVFGILSLRNILQRYWLFSVEFLSDVVNLFLFAIPTIWTFLVYISMFNYYLYEYKSVLENEWKDFELTKFLIFNIFRYISVNEAQKRWFCY